MITLISFIFTKSRASASSPHTYSCVKCAGGAVINYVKELWALYLSPSVKTQAYTAGLVSVYSHCITFTSFPRGIHSPLVGAFARKVLASSFPGSAGIQSSGFSSCSCNSISHCHHVWTSKQAPHVLTLRSEQCSHTLCLWQLYLYESWWRFFIAALRE